MIIFMTHPSRKYFKIDVNNTDNGLREECGLVGVSGFNNASSMLFLGLHSLQHRGQESAGIAVSSDQDKIKDHTNNFHQDHNTTKYLNQQTFDQNKFPITIYKDFGPVSRVFDNQTIKNLQGNIGIGHVRYATSESGKFENIQPFHFTLPNHGSICLAHNGNITNAQSLRAQLQDLGSVFCSTSDSEVIIHLLARSKKATIEQKLIEAISHLKGGFALLFLAENCIYGIRDRYGIRPMVIGKCKNNQKHVLASETCAFDLLEVDYCGELNPGQLIKIDQTNNSVQTKSILPSSKRAFCSFEPIYFSRVDSRCGEESIYDIRKRIGKVLSELYPCEADCVLAVPDSSMAIAIGYSQAANIPLELGMVRNHYIGRTFIEPSQKARDTGVMMKLNANRSVIENKRCIVIDDSIVRGTTSLKIAKMLKNIGAKQIHFRIGSPPVTHSCYYGISTPNRKELIAAQIDVEKIRQELDIDSLGFLTRQGLLKALLGEDDTGCYQDDVSDRTLENHSFCMACFAGTYPEKIANPLAYEAHPTDKQGCGYYAKAKKDEH